MPASPTDPEDPQPGSPAEDPRADPSAHSPVRTERADRLLRACRREPVDVTPVWVMRQAGRALPSYRKLREKYDLVEITAHPELCAEVTLLPLAEMEMDAAIMFADIMLPLASLGVEFDLIDGVGPVIAEPLRTREQIEAMPRMPASEAVPSVLEAIRLVRKELEGVVPLIGFSGAPFTLASYLIEGRPTRDFSTTKELMFSDPEAWHLLMGKLADLVADYLSEQVSAGAQALQLFDSWIGALSPSDFERYALPHTTRIFEATSGLGVPRIHFGTNTAALLEGMSAPRPEVVGVDWRLPLDAAWDRIGFDRAIQGNLDPAVLLGTPDLIRSRTLEVLGLAEGRPGHIFNLGHGLLPQTPLDNLKLMVDVVHEHYLA